MPRVSDHVEALARGLKVYSLIERGVGVFLHDLHAATEIPKSSLVRILHTLESANYVRRRLIDGAWLPTRTGERNDRVDAWQVRLAEIAAPVLENLHAVVPWPADIGVRDGTTMLVLDSNRRLSALRVDRRVLGFRPHMLWSALGKAYLAFCPAAEREAILELLRRSNAAIDRPARNRKLVERMLDDTRRTGYGRRDPRQMSLDVGFPRQLSAIAVPVVGGERILGCINCVWVVDVATELEFVTRWLPYLREAAAEVACSFQSER